MSVRLLSLFPSLLLPLAWEDCRKQPVRPQASQGSGFGVGGLPVFASMPGSLQCPCSTANLSRPRDAKPHSPGAGQICCQGGAVSLVTFSPWYSSGARHLATLFPFVGKMSREGRMNMGHVCFSLRVFSLHLSNRQCWDCLRGRSRGFWAVSFLPHLPIPAVLSSLTGHGEN